MGSNAITLQQPYATLLVRGCISGFPVNHKADPIKLRGKLLIHAGNKFDEDNRGMWSQFTQWDTFFDDPPLHTILVGPMQDELDAGKIIGEVLLYDIVPYEDALVALKGDDNTLSFIEMMKPKSVALCSNPVAYSKDDMVEIRGRRGFWKYEGD